MEKEGYRENMDMLLKMFPGKMTISVDECATAMSADRRTVYAAIKRKQNPIPAKRLADNKIVIPIPMLARWMA